MSTDVHINPDLSEFTWIESYRPMELIAHGAEATERALPELKRVLAERLRARPPREARPARVAAMGTP